jgi:hypothetical protein
MQSSGHPPRFFTISGPALAHPRLLILLPQNSTARETADANAKSFNFEAWASVGDDGSASPIGWKRM